MTSPDTAETSIVDHADRAVDTAATCPFHSSPVVSGGQCPVSPRAAAFDPFSDAYQQNPPAYVAWSRAEEPVFWSPELGYWVITRYDDVKAVFRDNITYSPANVLEKITPTIAEANEVLATYGYAMNRTLVNEDEPAHMARRRLLLEPFTPAALAVHEPMVRRLAREYVGSFIDKGRADLVDDMFWEVTLTVALHFLGVPEEDMDTLRRYSIAHTVNTWGRPTAAEQVSVAHAVGNFWTYAGRVLEKMRADPDQPGWMQFGIRLQADHPEIVTDSYLHSMMMAGIVAAHETTANASANAMKLLLEHRGAWDELCADPSLIPNAVEECLRHNGSVAAWRRLTTRESVIGGITIPAGAKLLIVSSSANHDERHFDDPERFDLHRENAGDQLTFGYGSHQCMGKNLARMEMRIFLEELTRRLPHVQLESQRFTYIPNTSFRGPEHLWVTWDPTHNPERTDSRVALPRDGAGSALDQQGRSRAAATRELVVATVVAETDNIVRVKLEEPKGRTLPTWTAGAHIDIECGSPDRTRQYSLCGDIDDRSAYEIAVLREQDGRGGSQWLHDHVYPGAVLKMRGPRNHFRLDEQSPKAIFIAGGIGITPIIAMAQRARAIGIDYHVHYCGRSRASMAAWQALCDTHGGRVTLYCGDEGARLDLDTLLREPMPGTTVHACGPARLLDAVESSCSAWPPEALRTERFAAATPVLDAAHEHGFEVELKDTGLVIPVRPDQTLLQALRQANVDVGSDCEEGLCGSCEVRVLQGDVDHRDHVLTRGERERNDRMMSCCSRARGKRLVLEL